MMQQIQREELSQLAEATSVLSNVCNLWFVIITDSADTLSNLSVGLSLFQLFK